jgi:HrpA-like RNA helicase
MNLDGTLLQILAQDQDPRDFPFIDPPTDQAMAAALASLEELGALVELDEPEPEPEPVLVVGQAAAGTVPPPKGSQQRHGSRLVCTALGESLSVLPVDLPAVLLISCYSLTTKHNRHLNRTSVEVEITPGCFPGISMRSE